MEQPEGSEPLGDQKRIRPNEDQPSFTDLKWQELKKNLCPIYSVSNRN